MTRRIPLTWTAAALCVLLLAGCQTNSRDQVLATSQSQLALICAKSVWLWREL